jgi:uncharacterized membrane protein (Fun14 family)
MDFREHRELEKIMSMLDDLAASVAAEKTVVGSAVTLLQGLSQKIADAGTDPQKLADLKAAVDDQTKTLSDAVIANTPAADASATQAAVAAAPPEPAAAATSSTPAAAGASETAPPAQGQGTT